MYEAQKNEQLKTTELSLHDTENDSGSREQLHPSLQIGYVYF